MKVVLRIFSIIALAVAILLALDSRLKCVWYHIQSERILGEITLALITDLHNCLYGEGQGQLLQKIAEAQPDILLLGGDIFDDAYINDNGRTLVEGLAGTYRTYYVSGNHEWWSGRMHEFFSFLEAAGVSVLRGTSDLVEINGSWLTIGGVDDPEVNSHDKTYMGFEEQLEAVASYAKEGNFNLLLAHRPELARQYFSHNFDLVLAGHSHGGQLRIPLLLNGLYAPNQGLFPNLAGGCYVIGKGNLIVSRGLSKENTILPRIFNRPELVFISLSNHRN